MNRALELSMLAQSGPRRGATGEQKEVSEREPGPPDLTCLPGDTES